jgi:hypothetical protein
MCVCRSGAAVARPPHLQQRPLDLHQRHAPMRYYSRSKNSLGLAALLISLTAALCALTGGSATPIATALTRAARAPTQQAGPEQRSNSTWWLDGYPGLGPPRFPEDGAQAAETCYALWHRATSAQCTAYDSPVPGIHLNNCVSPQQRGSGVLVVEWRPQPAAAGRSHGTAMYRLRLMGGGLVWLLEPVYCRHDLSFASYQLPTTAPYSLEVVQLYTDYWLSEPSRSLPAAQPWAGHLTLQAGPEANNTGSTHHQLRPEPDATVLGDTDTAGGAGDQHAGRAPLPHDALPLCADTGPLPGRWAYSSAATPRVTPLLTTCVWGDARNDCAGPARRPLSRGGLGLRGLTWQPHGCHMRPVAGLDAALERAAATALAHGAQHGRALLTAPSATAPAAQLPAAARFSAAGALPGPNPSRPALVSLPTAMRRPAASATTRPRLIQARRGLRESAASSPSSCLPPGRRVVCLAGDSHARYLANSLTMWLAGFPKGLEPNNTAKQLLPSPGGAVQYVRLLWGHDWPKPGGAGSGPGAAGGPVHSQPSGGVGGGGSGGGGLNASGLSGGGSAAADAFVALGCTDVVANVGTWPASYRAGATPASPGAYARCARRLRIVFVHAAKLQRGRHTVRRWHGATRGCF